MARLKKEEVKLIGNIEKTGTAFIEDKTTKRIKLLTKNYLKKLACDESGRNILYQDPMDNRYWALMHPHNETQGGSSPHLINLSQEEVKDKFKLKNI